MFIANPLFSQQLSDDAEIYVIVCSPGNELYQAFGHNAFLVQDSVNQINLLYHFGTFNYSDPNFYTNFARGKLDYMIAAENYDSFINEYTSGGRDVWKLKLNITNEKKIEIFDYLKWKSLEENRYYRYDFFMDNCATRIRDVIEIIYGDSIAYPVNYNIDLTYRQTIKPYSEAKPWIRFGSNLILGMPADKKLDFYSAMYLPYYIDTVFNNTNLVFDNQTENLITDREYLIHSDYEIGERPFFNPTLVFWSLFVIISLISVYEIKRKKVFKAINFTYLLVTGIVSLVILFLWFFSEHVPTKWNLNILWALPTHLVFAFIYLKKNKFMSKYLIFTGIVLLILTVTYPIFPQQFDVALIPFFLVFGARFLVHAKFKIQ